MNRRSIPRWEQALSRYQERLCTPTRWFPFPFLISFLFYMLLTDFVSLTLNPRLGNPAQIITLPSEKSEGSGIWLSLAAERDTLIITTGDRRVFRLPLAPDFEQVRPLVQFLRARIMEDTLTAGLSITVSSGQARVTLAVDQHLNFAHINPVLYALAQAQITNFAFETRIPSREPLDEHMKDG